MPRGKRARRRNQTVSAAHNDITIHRDERSTALLATTLNIASEPEMKVSAKRALSECLESDELYSEVVHDDMWTGNSAGLRIARDNSQLRVFQTQLESLQAELKVNRKEISDLHNALNEVGQRDYARYIVGFSQIRSRFISTFRRDILKNPSKEDKELIGKGNIVAHEGNFRADAELYECGRFVAGNATQVLPRNDKDVFKLLYGVTPSFAQIINYTPTILVLDKHATIVSSLNMQTTDIFKQRFEEFIRCLMASDFASNYLDSDSPDHRELRLAYRRFWDAIRTEVIH
ncbi:hypothetical protein BDV40DRAFT_309309 [Aspergillus tamarii]|uniref:Uncharacterized protein n=1 Tax=Aspergillus tamarii TaxID=41984 RepID=A0A5N6UDT7_ASPTM|nr:hypothetical protein BDV40DRAFT_309309 [Aspergillus tamarii]